MKREGIVYSSLLQLAGALLAGPEPMPSRLVRGCIAMAFTACVLAVACSHCLADTSKSGELHDTSNETRGNRVQLATAAGRGGPGRP